MPVVVGFWAEWCVPCHMAAPALESAEQQHHGKLRFGLVNFDENPRLVERYSVQGLPTILLMKDGRIIEQGKADEVLAQKSDVIAEVAAQ